MNGSNQLSYNYIENRSFLICLYKHILYFLVTTSHSRYTSRKGCWRTAFEQSKLLLSFDNDDPLGMLLVIDFFAIMSNETAWLMLYFDQYRASKNLMMLPNWAFSIALAEYKSECENDENGFSYTKSALNRLQVRSVWKSFT